MTLRYYSNSASTTVTAALTSTATTVSVAATTGFPIQYPFTAIIDKDNASEEVVLVTGGSGTTFTITRGYDSTTNFSHAIGATFVQGISAIDPREANAHVNANAGVHGVTGALVGTTDVQTLTNKNLAGSGNTFPSSLVTTTDTQTLTNKTLTSPTITSPNFGGTSFAHAPWDPGTPGVVAVTSTYTEVPGLNVSVTATAPTTYLVIGFVGFYIPSANSQGYVNLYIDGVGYDSDGVAAATVGGGGTTSVYMPVSQTWAISVAAGTHTFSLRVSGSSPYPMLNGAGSLIAVRIL